MGGGWEPEGTLGGFAIWRTDLESNAESGVAIQKPNHTHACPCAVHRMHTARTPTS